MPLTPEQQQQAKNDLLLADLELRLEQIRSMKAFENWRFVVQIATAGAAIGGLFVGLIALLLHR